MHVDFLRVDEKTPITMRVPLIVKNIETCKGVKQQGGRLSILMNDVEITCLPKHLPSEIVVDIAGLEAGSAFLLANAVLPTGVSIPALAKPQNANMPVAKVRKPRGAAIAK
jgi:large subunit ribosomal protein L25